MKVQEEKQPIMKNVAKLAHVSTATVSNVLTGKRVVSDKSRKCVLDAMEQLGFVPNQAARSLRNKRTYTIDVVVPDITNSFYGNIINTVASYANKQGYHLVLGNYNNDSSQEQAELTAIMNAGVEGIVYLSPRLDEEMLPQTPMMPMVLVDRTRFVTDKNIGFIYANNYLGGSLAAERLLKRDFQRYICVAGIGKKGRNAIQRVDGFRDSLLRNGVPESQITVANCELTFEFQSVYKLTEKLIASGTLTPNTGVFVCSDLGAWGAIEAIKQAGLRIPEDVGIIGYDNISWAEWFNPKLTTIENNQEKLGKQAAKMLIEAIETRQQLCGKYVLLDVCLIERESV